MSDLILGFILGILIALGCIAILVNLIPLD